MFTDTPLHGNPLAVFPDADAMTDGEMQAVAREMMLSETTFVVRATESGAAAGADYRMRIFTPTVELPFAGHPSIGTAWVWPRPTHSHRTPTKVRVQQEVRSASWHSIMHIDRNGAGRGSGR